MGDGSRVRPAGSRKTRSHPCRSRRNRNHRQLFSGFAPATVSSPLANTRSSKRQRQVEPWHHSGPAPLLAGSKRYTSSSAWTVADAAASCACAWSRRVSRLARPERKTRFFISKGPHWVVTEWPGRDAESCLERSAPARWSSGSSSKHIIRRDEPCVETVRKGAAVQRFRQDRSDLGRGARSLRLGEASSLPFEADKGYNMDSTQALDP